MIYIQAQHPDSTPTYTHRRNITYTLTIVWNIGLSGLAKLASRHPLTDVLD